MLSQTILCPGQIQILHSRIFQLFCYAELRTKTYRAFVRIHQLIYKPGTPIGSTRKRLNTKMAQKRDSKTYFMSSSLKFKGKLKKKLYLAII